MNSYFNHIDTPFGPVTTEVDSEGAVRAIHFGIKELIQGQLDPGRTAAVDQQLSEYFARERKTFDLELNPDGTAFQRQVWALLVQIPFGETRSYGQLAKAMGQPGSSRAVGRANATNPIAIVVPCHRVIGSNGTLTGYAGGLEMKKGLLEFEQALDQNLFTAMR